MRGRHGPGPSAAAPPHGKAQSQGSQRKSNTEKPSLHRGPRLLTPTPRGRDGAAPRLTRRQAAAPGAVPAPGAQQLQVGRYSLLAHPRLPEPQRGGNDTLDWKTTPQPHSLTSSHSLTAHADTVTDAHTQIHTHIHRQIHTQTHRQTHTRALADTDALRCRHTQIHHTHTHRYAQTHGHTPRQTYSHSDTSHTHRQTHGRARSQTLSLRCRHTQIHSHTGMHRQTQGTLTLTQSHTHTLTGAQAALTSPLTYCCIVRDIHAAAAHSRREAVGAPAWGRGFLEGG